MFKISSIRARFRAWRQNRQIKKAKREKVRAILISGAESVVKTMAEKYPNSSCSFKFGDEHSVYFDVKIGNTRTTVAVNPNSTEWTEEMEIVLKGLSDISSWNPKILKERRNNDIKSGIVGLNLTKRLVWAGAVITERNDGLEISNFFGNELTRHDTHDLDDDLSGASLDISRILIPESVAEIGRGAFRGLKKIEFVRMASVEKIGTNAFRNCRKLSAVEFGPNLKKIGNAAFKGCPALESLDLPGALSEVGNAAFENCASLTEIRFGGTVEQWEGVRKGNSSSCPASCAK